MTGGTAVGGRGRATPRRGAAAARRSVTAGRMFLPSALTVLAICCGLSAMRFADDDRVDLAMALLVAAAVLDGLDGRVARMMDATSAIGAEIDSLADAINFGVVPAVMVYTTLLRDSGPFGKDFGWFLVLLYCVAIVLRLARFNTLLDDDSAPAYTKDFFVGVPAPAAALMALLPVGITQHFGHGWWSSPGVVGGWLVFTGFLAVSRIPTFSFKAAKIRPSSLGFLLVLVAVFGALLMTYPYVLLMILIAAYLVHIPFAWRSQRWVASRPDSWDAAAADRRKQRREERRGAPSTARPRVGPSKSSARLGLRRPQTAQVDVPPPATDTEGDTPAVG